MTVTVDARTLTVRDGDRQYSFAADCAAGTAVLEADGRSIGIRLLRWGEKCALARFASAGADFLAAQLLYTCVDAPQNEPVRDAALALVLWLHAPDEPPLPMDARLLARVTLDLSHALGSRIEELAGRSAPEVEELWRALDRPQYAAGQMVPDDDVTQIIVLPDEPGNAPAGIAGVPDTAAQPVATAGAPPPSLGGIAPNAVPSIGAGTPVPMGAVPPPAAAMDAVERPRFRVRLAPPPASASTPTAANSDPVGVPPPLTARPAATAASPESDRSAVLPAGEPSPAHVAVPAVPSGTTPHAATRVTPLQTPLAVATGLGTATDPQIAALARVIAAVSRRPAAPQSAATSDDAYLGDLAERLEEAADALGIALVD